MFFLWSWQSSCHWHSVVHLGWAKSENMPGKIVARNVFLFTMGIFNATLVAVIVVLTGMMLIAADIFMTFVIVLSFWAILFYILLGEVPIHMQRKTPETPGIPVKNK